MCTRFVISIGLFVLSVLSVSNFAQGQLYDISDASVDSVRVLKDGSIIVDFENSEQTLPCPVRIIGDGLLPTYILNNITTYQYLIQDVGSEETLLIELDDGCRFQSYLVQAAAYVEDESWAAFVYGTTTVEEERERVNEDTGDTETYMHPLNRIVFGDIFADATSRDAAVENAQLTCETSALERGLDTNLCDVILALEGGRNACISYATTFDSNDYGQFIGVSSGENHLKVKMEATASCVAAVQEAGSYQNCDAYNDTQCNEYGHLFDPEPEQSTRLSRGQIQHPYRLNTGLNLFDRL